MAPLTREQTTDTLKLIKSSITELFQEDEFLQKFTEKVANNLKESFKEEINKLEVNIQEMKKENMALTEKVDALEQYSRRNNVRIFGIPEDVGGKENLEDKVISLCTDKLGVRIAPEKIDRCHRLGSVKPGAPRAVIVKFVSYKDRCVLFNNKKLFKGTRVVVSEDLTRSKHVLFKAAKLKIGKNKVWTYDGMIYAKINNIKCSIKSMSDLDDK